MDLAGRSGRALSRLVGFSGIGWPYLAHGAILFAQSAYLVDQKTLGFKLTAATYAVHLLLLAGIVMAEALLGRALPEGRISRISRTLLAALVQGGLLALYIANHLALEYVAIPFSFNLVAIYLDDPLPLVESAGLKLWTVLAGAFVFAASIAAINAALFMRALPEAARRWPPFIALGMLALLYLLAPQTLLQREMLHRLNGETAAKFGPDGLLTFAEPRLETRYSTPQTAIRPRTLVLISLDSVRPDSLGLYGGPPGQSPFLDGLHAEEKLQRFDNAHSVCSFSYCGIVGMLSSRYWRGMEVPPDNVIDALDLEGYRTHVFASGHHRALFNLHRQYGPRVDVFRDGWDAQRNINDDRNVLDWLEASEPSGSQPNFYFIHLMAAHRLAYRDRDTRDAGSLPALADATSAEKFRARHFDCVRRADGVVEGIFAWLEEEGLLEDAFIVLTADHGEYLGEEGLVAHGHAPTSLQTRVPLLIYDARQDPLPARAIASTVDIAPTLLQAVGARRPDGWAGVSLQDKTQRCAIETASDGYRTLLGERWQYWEMRGDGDTRSYLGPAESVAEPAEKVDTPNERKIAERLSECLERR